MLKGNIPIFISLNAVLLAGFCYFASWTWLPDTPGIPVGAADVAFWVLLAFPILVLAALFNFVYLLLFFYKTYKRQKPSRGVLLVWIVVIGIWLVAVSYDHHRHQPIPIE